MMLLGVRGRRRKQAVMGEIWCFESLVLLVETFETSQRKLKKKLLAIFNLRFFRKKKKKEGQQHPNQRGSQINALELLISIVAPIGEKRQIFSSNLIWVGGGGWGSKTSQFEVADRGLGRRRRWILKLFRCADGFKLRVGMRWREGTRSIFTKYC